MSPAVTDEWTPEGKRFMEEIAQLARLEVAVGFQNGTVHKKRGGGKGKPQQSITVAEVAAVNDLGIGRTPSRPFLRNSVDLHAKEIQNFGGGLAKILVKGGTAEEMLKALGVFQKGIVQKEILEGHYLPNSPRTIKQKGSSKPLIDTGQMLQSVTFVVRERKG